MPPASKRPVKRSFNMASCCIRILRRFGPIARAQEIIWNNLVVIGDPYTPPPLPPEIRRIVNKMRTRGAGSLNPEECCKLVQYQLTQIMNWEVTLAKELADSGSGGGGTPPPPPKWPPA